MNVSIDLLPQSRKVKVDRFPFLLGASAVVLALTVFLIFSFIHTKQSVKVLGETIVKQTELRNELQTEYTTRTSGVTEFNFVDNYIAVDSFMNQIYQDTTDVKGKVYKLLPANALVTNYAYVNGGALSMTINFATKNDAATYLNNLLFADFVKKAEVDTISTDEGNFVSNFRVTLVTLVGEGQ